MIKYICPDSISSLPIGDCTFNGAIADLMDKLFYNRINSDFARKKVYQETIDAYRNRVDDAKKVIGIWQGEYWGKWVMGAVRTARYSHNAELKSFVRSAVYELLTCQLPDGCISTYRNPDFFTSAPPEEVEKVLGRRLNWNWNIWCRKYTLWGLLEAWELLQEEPILIAAERLADQLITSLERTQSDIHDTGTFCGMPSCSILKPMLLLYRYTGNDRFLKFADFIVSGWKRGDGKLPDLISNALAGKPVHLWTDDPNLHWAKAYEMLSCFDGLLEYYRVTGDKTALDASESLYHLLNQYELNLLGSVGFNDQFVNASRIMESITEPCDVIHWMRLCGELFKITGKAEYLDTFEFACCNAFFASTFRDGKWGLRGARSSGHHLRAPGQAEMLYNHCCVNNLPRGFINAAECAVMCGNGAVYINFYFPGECNTTLKNGDPLSLSISDGYLQNGEVAITASAASSLTLRLRIPAWSRESSVALNGEIFTAGPGFMDLMIPAGRSVIQLKFDHRAVLRDVSGVDPETLHPWYALRYRSDEQGVSSESKMSGTPGTVVQAGPLMLARSQLIGNTVQEIFNTPSLHGKKGQCTLHPVKIPGVFAGFNAEFTAQDGTKFTAKLCDYASAGNVDTDEGDLFSMFF